MPRNGSGTMSVTNSFSSGTTISSSEMNANFTDFASEVTNSLPRDGQAAMTGQLKITAGTAAAPGLIFSTDTDTGIYRVAADTLGIAAGGAIVAQADSTGVKNAAGENYDAFPAGTAMLFMNATAPTGWTGIDSQDDYALRIVSTSGGQGGQTGGTTGFLTVFDNRTIAVANLPNATITVTDSGHTHDQFADVTSNTDGLSGSNQPAKVGTITGDTAYTITSSATAATLGLTSSETTGITAAIDNTTRGGAQTAMDFDVLYQNAIIATKD